MNNKTVFSALFVLFLSALAFPVWAQDADKNKEKLDAPEYSPNYCQFTASFPEEPYITRRCDGESEDTCYNLISYTKVFDMSATVKVELICNPATPAMYKQFTEESMGQTVRAMTKGTAIETYEVNSRVEDHYKQAGLVGRARHGLDESIYIAQLWIASHSIMSVEAELIGDQHDDADQLFAEILQSIGHVEDIKGAGALQDKTDALQKENAASGEKNSTSPESSMND